MAEALAGMVRSLRERALLSQEELAARSGLSVSTIRGIESGRIGRPRQSSIRRLADVLAPAEPDRQRLLATSRSEPVDADAPAMGDRPVPAQLPAGVAGFAGRVAALIGRWRGSATRVWWAPLLLVARRGGGCGVGRHRHDRCS